MSDISFISLFQSSDPFLDIVRILITTIFVTTDNYRVYLLEMERALC